MKETIKNKLSNLVRILLGTIAALGLLYGAFVAFSGGAALDPSNIEAALNQAREESLPAPPTGEPLIVCGDHSIYDCPNGHITERTK